MDTVHVANRINFNVFSEVQKITLYAYVDMNISLIAESDQNGDRRMPASVMATTLTAKIRLPVELPADLPTTLSYRLYSPPRPRILKENTGQDLNPRNRLDRYGSHAASYKMR